jgi:hypothetical protein
MSHVSTSYTVRLGCAADVIHAGEQVVWYENQSQNGSHRLHGVICHSGFRKPCYRQKKVCPLYSSTNNSLCEMKGRGYFLNYLWGLCVYLTVLFDVYTLHYMLTLPNDFTLIDVLLL